MVVDFKYVPLSGDLSGASFEEQTERAFNELGAEIVDIADTADTALSTANTALSTANTALVAAENAQSAADAAQASADAAQASADAAQASADAAQNRADSAYDLAASASGSGGAALVAAAAAQARADDAYDLAEQADGKADSAQLTANLALSTADRMYETLTAEDGETIDANNYYSRMDTFIPVDADVLNFPWTSGPFYFEVLADREGTTATQNVWSYDGLSYFTRVAAVSSDDPPVVSWTPWLAVARKADIDSKIDRGYTNILDVGTLAAGTLNELSPNSIKSAPGTDVSVVVADVPPLVDKLITITLEAAADIAVAWSDGGGVPLIWKSEEVLESMASGAKAIVNVWYISGMKLMELVHHE